MSISRKSVAVPCPNCGTMVRFSLLSSIDARRDPDLRTAILHRTLQERKCDACGASVRPPPAFMYFDRRCNLWVSAHAWTNGAAWRDWEARARTNLQTIYDSGSSIARQMHAGPVRARVTFGWEALREKIIAAEHDVDDVGLEMWKYHRAQAAGNPAAECRLISVARRQAVVAHIAPNSEEIIERARVPRNEFNQRPASAADRALRHCLEQGLFVDIRRLKASG